MDILLTSFVSIILLITNNMDNCTIDCIEVFGNFSQEATCAFVQDNCLQDTVQFVQAYYCLANSSLMVLGIVSVIVMLFIYYAINIATDDFLAPCLEDFIDKLNLSQAMAGITFLALANGAPDIITAIVAGTSSSDSTVLIPFGSLYGAALFSMGFILSQVIYYSKGRRLVLNVKETAVPLGFYILGTLYLVLVSILYGKMNIGIAVIFFSFYLLYFCYVLYCERKKRKAASGNSLITDKQQKDSISAEKQDYEKVDVDNPAEFSEDEEDKKERLAIEKQRQENKLKGVKKSLGDEVDDVYRSIHEKEEQNDKKDQKNIFGWIKHIIRVIWMFLFNHTIPVILKNEVNNTKLIISLVLSPGVLMLSKGVPGVFSDGLLEVPYAVWFVIPSCLLLIYLIYNIIRGTKPYFTTIFNLYSFVVVVTWITLVVGVLINLMELLQLLTNINSVFLGLTVFAGAASIGDYISITTFAKRGFSSTAVSGVFSGQLLNFLIGFGIAIILNSLDGEYDFDIFQITGDTYDILSDLIVIIVITLAFIYMVGMLVIVLMKRGQLENRQRNMARVYYAGFLIITLGFSILTDFFRDMHCDM